MAKKKEEIPTTNPTEIEALIDRLKGSQLKEGDAELIERLLRTLVTLLDLLNRKNFSIKKLKEMLFGRRRTEKQPKKDRQEKEKSEVSKEEQNKSPQSSADSADSKEKAARPGHGRRAASEYSGAKVVNCQHDKLKPGDPCPECGGRLYDRNEPKIFMNFVGRPLIEATTYLRQILRCSICLKQYVAPLPDGVDEEERFDPSADATIALMKYGGGLPWSRQAALQQMCGVPISESVMWERCENVANAFLRIYLRLLQLGANGELFHTDDTKMVILSCLKEDKEKQEKGEKNRVTQTSGMVIKSGEHWITFYFSARRHAGENLVEVFKLRQAGLEPPIQSADALKANWAHSLNVKKSNCLIHARRGVWEVQELDTEVCGVVLKAISKVYKHEAETETKGMSKEERLKYHQEKSGPVMEELKEWIERQFGESLVEPNSSVGKALQYWLNHWDGLTLWLRVAGAPLDNNAVERALKQFILMRKNSLFYKTEHGAAVGDILNSLIHTCRLNKVNPFDYLVTILYRRKEAHRDPDRFLPWNYPRDETDLAVAD